MNTARVSILEIAALCVGNALGTCVGFLVPIWVAAFISEGFLPVQKVGWLATAQLTLLASAGITTSLWGGAFSLRRIAATLSALIAFATGLTAFHTYTSVVTGLFFFALASGILHALMIRAGALSANAARVLALMTAAAMGFGSVVTFLSRRAMQYVGVTGLFLMVAALSVGAGVFMFIAFPDRGISSSTSVPRGEPEKRFSLSSAAVLACVAGALVNMASMTSGAYTVLIGSRLGFGSSAATSALAVSEPFALVGPFGAHQLGEHLGVIRPIVIALAVLAVNQFLLVNAPSVQVFSLALIIGGVTFAFYMPYAMTLVGRLDPSGRLVGALPGLITVGASIGPALGGTVMNALSFRTLAPVAAALYIAALLLFWSTSRRMMNGPTR